MIRASARIISFPWLNRHCVLVSRLRPDAGKTEASPAAVFRRGRWPRGSTDRSTAAGIGFPRSRSVGTRSLAFRSRSVRRSVPLEVSLPRFVRAPFLGRPISADEPVSRAHRIRCSGLPNEFPHSVLHVLRANVRLTRFRWPTRFPSDPFHRSPQCHVRAILDRFAEAFLSRSFAPRSGSVPPKRHLPVPCRVLRRSFDIRSHAPSWIGSPKRSFRGFCVLPFVVWSGVRFESVPHCLARLPMLGRRS
jgi:hypothetical protein